MKSTFLRVFRLAGHLIRLGVVLCLALSGFSRGQKIDDQPMFPIVDGVYALSGKITIKAERTISGVAPVENSQPNWILNHMAVDASGHDISLYCIMGDAISNVFRKVPLIPDISMIRKVKTREDAIEAFGRPGEIGYQLSWRFFSCYQKFMKFCSITIYFSSKGDAIGHEYITGEYRIKDTGLVLEATPPQNNRIPRPKSQDSK